RLGFDVPQIFHHGPRQSFGQSRVFIHRQVGHYQDYSLGSLIGAERQMVVSESLSSEGQTAKGRHFSGFQRPAVPVGHQQRDEAGAARVDQMREFAVTEVADVRRPQLQFLGALRGYLIQPDASPVVFSGRFRHFSRPSRVDEVGGAGSVI